MSHIFVLFLSVVATHLVASSPAWTWKIFTDEKDIWLRSSCDGVIMFDCRLGAGGSISEMRRVQAGNKRLLSPSFKGEATDRIIQWTWWSDSITNPIAELPKSEHRFNVTQGGNFAGQLSPIISVQIRPNADLVDVYSVPQDQWKTQQHATIQSKISALTRYEMKADGVLNVRRVMLVDVVKLHGKETNFSKLYIEGWSPFDRSGTFDGLALSVDEKGTPNWWYRAGENIPTYPGFAVAKTAGYAVVYQTSQPKANPAVGLVFGTGEVISENKNSAHVLNTMSWNNGIGILPALRLADVAEGSVIDITIALLPRNSLDTAMAKHLHALVPQIPAPRVHSPTTVFTDEMAEIVAKLRSNLSATGKSTEHLADFISAPP